MGHPTFFIRTCEYAELSKYTIVINKYTTDRILWFSVTPQIAQKFTLYQIDEIRPTGPVEVDYSEKLEHDCCNVWYQLMFDVLNQEPGQHIYRLHFINTSTKETVSLYFAYILQDDNPDTPYIYMKSEDIKTSQ